MRKDMSNFPLARVVEVENDDDDDQVNEKGFVVS